MSGQFREQDNAAVVEGVSVSFLVSLPDHVHDSTESGGSEGR